MFDPTLLRITWRHPLLLLNLPLLRLGKSCISTQSDFDIKVHPAKEWELYGGFRGGARAGGGRNRTWPGKGGLIKSKYFAKTKEKTCAK